MASLAARIQRPVVRLVGRRLAAADTGERMRRVIGRANALLAPCPGITTEPFELGGRGGLRVVPKACLLYTSSDEEVVAHVDAVYTIAAEYFSDG